MRKRGKSMSRLIDADKIDFNEVFVGASDFAKDTREAAQMLIDAQPTIEAAPVVQINRIIDEFAENSERSRYAGDF